MDTLKSCVVLKNYANRFYSTLNEMRQNGIGTDVVLVCNEKEFPAHQMILSAGSPYIKKMFETEFKETTTRTINFSYVNEETLAFLIDFLYLQPTKLVEKSLEDLIEIHDMSHLFGMHELSDMCWEEMKKRINLENCVDIWNKRSLYTNQYSIEEILTFILNNLHTVFESKRFLALNESQMQLLLEKIHEKPTEVSLLEGILEWIKSDDSKPNERLNLLYYVNFEKISREYVEDMMKREESLFDSGMIKSYLDIQVIPSLQSISMISNHERPKADFTGFTFFSFGYKFEIRNNEICKQCDALKIIDVMDEGDQKYQVKLLPVKIKEIVLSFCSNTRIYLVSELSTSKMMLQIYDWETYSVMRQVYISDKFQVSSGCVIDNKIYLIGKSEENDHKTEIEVRNISQCTDHWNTVKLSVPSIVDVVGSVNLKGKLYVLCKGKDGVNGSRYSSYRSEDDKYKNKSVYSIHSLDKNIKNFEIDMRGIPKDSEFDLKSFIVHECLLENELITQCDGKCYVFLLSFDNLFCFVYHPNHEHWNRFDLGPWKADLGKPLKCCKGKNNLIVICTTNGNVAFFNCKKNEIIHSSVKIYHLESSDNFIVLGNNKNFDCVIPKK